MPSPESLLLSVSKPPRQVRFLTLRVPIQDDEKPGDVAAFKHLSLHPPSPQSPSVSSDIKEFVLIPQHTSPANTTKELDELYDVLQHVRRMWKTDVSFPECS